MKRSIRDIDGLIAEGFAGADVRAQLQSVTSRYALNLPEHLSALISASGDLGLAKQFIPDARELNEDPSERADPIGDGAFSPIAGLVHRYPDRVLIKLVHVCPVYCRFCFRRAMVGPNGDGHLSDQALAAICDYIRLRPQIWEVILTGGDPLMLSARRIERITRALAAIPHIKILRWHTRMPIADPQRITPALVKALKAKDATTYVAIHVNQAEELVPEARAAISRLSKAGLSLVSQSVLLKGVNDNVVSLEALMRSLVEAGIKPYYLHHPDLAPGTSHFRVTLAQGQKLVRALRQRLSGLAMPSYVLDVPDGAGKVPLGPAHLTFEGDAARLTTLDGRSIAYPPPSGD